MSTPKNQIDPLVELQEERALVVFLRARCAHLAQLLALEKGISVSLRSELDEAAMAVKCEGERG